MFSPLRAWKVNMSNRRIQMYEYRTIIYRLQQGQTIRAIQRDGLAGREKIKAIQEVARQQGWLDSSVTIPDEAELVTLFSHLTNKRLISSLSTKFFSLRDERQEKTKQISCMHKLLFSYFNEGPNISSEIHVHQIIQKILRIKENHLMNKKITFHFQHSRLTTLCVAHNPYWFIFLHEMLDVFIQESPAGTRITYQLVPPNTLSNLPFFQLIFTDDLPIPSFAFKKISKHDAGNDTCSQETLRALLETLGLFIHISFSMGEGNKLVIAIPLNAPTSKHTQSNVILFNR